MRIVSIVGARPQFVKAAPLVRELTASRDHTSILVHTGQHYDANMSDVFFEELGLPAPDHHLGVGSGPHGAQTAAMLERLEPVLTANRPDWVVVFGDTNSTLAGALAASKLRLRIAHVEAGLRSFNRAMPEEINRVIADLLADLRLCPSDAAAANLAREGIRGGVHVVGDLMAESLAASIERARERSRVLERLGVDRRRFLLLTIHRAGTADDPAVLDRVLRAVARSGAAERAEPVIFPVHPRTRRALEAVAQPPAAIRFVEPAGYLDMLQLIASARLVVTDSGGVQKEAYWLGTPCVTLRDETEWTETVEAGWNRVVGTDAARIRDAVATFTPPADRPALYVATDAGAGVARAIVSALDGAVAAIA
jgi:UDP-N-acetylglucosamine 2-epimerase